MMSSDIPFLAFLYSIIPTVLSPRSSPSLSYPPSLRPAATEAHLEPPSSSSRGQHEDELEEAVIHVTRYADGSTPRCTHAHTRAHTHQCLPRAPVCTLACIGLEIRFKGRGSGRRRGPVHVIVDGKRGVSVARPEFVRVHYQ